MNSILQRYGHNPQLLLPSRQPSNFNSHSCPPPDAFFCDQLLKRGLSTQWDPRLIAEAEVSLEEIGVETRDDALKH